MVAFSISAAVSWGGPSMCRETFELSQNLWNSDRGTAERTLDQGSKSFESSAVDLVVECIAECVEATFNL